MCVWGKSRDAKRDQPAGGDRALFMFGFSLSALSSFCLLLVLISSALFFAMSSEGKYSSVDFEIFGDVQGVCFRMYTEDQGKKLGVNGWVKNTRQGTVIGQVQGPRDKIDEMKHWLRHVGSPSSRIDRAEFTNERDISKLELHGFSTRY